MKMNRFDNEDPYKFEVMRLVEKANDFDIEDPTLHGLTKFFYALKDVYYLLRGYITNKADIKRFDALVKELRQMLKLMKATPDQVISSSQLKKIEPKLDRFQKAVYTLIPRLLGVTAITGRFEKIKTLKTGEATPELWLET